MERTRVSIHVLGSLQYLTLEPTGALQDFMDRSNTLHPQPQWRDIWRHSTRRQERLQEIWVFFCYFAIVWAIDDIKLLQWNYYWSQMKTNMNRWVVSWTVELKKLFLFVGAHPLVQKHWMTLGSHPWVQWISLTGALHDFNAPLA